MGDKARGIEVRKAREEDVPQVREIFLSVYGEGYPYQEFYSEQWLKRSVFSDDILMLVAEDAESGKILGTASVVFDIGAHSDLVGEFGRLAVHPDARDMRIGTLLMEKRIEAIEDRLHVAVIAGRVTHPYAQKIAMARRFAPVGFMPLKHEFCGARESLALLVRYFGEALLLRRNNPRVVPEAYPLADLALKNVSLPGDVIVDEEAPPYPYDSNFEMEELTAKGLPALLHIERGRVRHREVFGHMRLEYGFFKLRMGHATYLLAKSDGYVAGAVGFTLDHVEHIVRVFELIASTDQAIRFLLSTLEQKCREEWGVYYIEIDVSAHATRMQRTLLELKFLPVAYVPAMVFHRVERLDIVRMVRLNQPLELGDVEFVPAVKAVADLVMRGFRSRTVAPQIAEAVSEIPLFEGLNTEQLARFAGACSVADFEPGERIFQEKEAADAMYVVLEGEVGIHIGTPPVKIGKVGKGEMLGELSLLSTGRHSATAVSETPVQAVSLTHQDLSELVRRRPDIGLYLYKNLAAGLGDKLLRSDRSLRDRLLGESEPA